jgi:hypothetical protein
MAEASLARGVDPVDEFPHDPPEGVALWSENYCYQAYDPGRRLGIWFHLGRTPYDHDLWRQVLVLYLPDGDLLLNKSYGRGTTAAGPGAATMRIDVEQPCERLSFHFHGAVQRVAPAALRQWFLADGHVHEPARVDLTWSARSPMWDMGAEMRSQSWGHVHHEQIANVSGGVAFEGKEIHFSGTGIRDHTTGPRDFLSLSRHVWLSGTFPSGLSFAMIDVEVQDGSAHLSRAFISDGDGMREVTPVEVPFLSELDRREDPYTIVLDDRGQMVRIDGEVLHNMHFGFLGPNELTLGFDPTAAGNLACEGQSRFTLDGEVGYGLTERSLVNLAVAARE